VPLGIQREKGGRMNNLTQQLKQGAEHAIDSLSTVGAS
jgi:hypothetical protein